MHADSLTYLHLEDIRVETPNPRTLNFVDGQKIVMTADENIRETLTSLILQHQADDDQLEVESEDIEEDGDEDEAAVETID